MIKFVVVLVLLWVFDIINDWINSYCSDHPEHLYSCLFCHDTKTGLEQGEPCPYCRDKIYVKLEQEVKNNDCFE